nr:hypothetical protein [Brevibacillus laterosporus]
MEHKLNLSLTGLTWIEIDEAQALREWAEKASGDSWGEKSHRFFQWW